MGCCDAGSAFVPIVSPAAARDTACECLRPPDFRINECILESLVGIGKTEIGVLINEFAKARH
jgi:hypothetical protein